MVTGSPFLKSLRHVESYVGNDYKDHCKFKMGTYTRNLVTRNELFEVYVICWLGGQGSGIHNHSENGCLMKVLSGRLCETLYHKDLSLSVKTTIEEGSTSYMHNSLGYHKIENPGEESAISLHIYSPPNHEAKIIL
jgi:cysteine dioxygenase